MIVYEAVSNLPVTLATPSSRHVYNIVSLIKAVVWFNIPWIWDKSNFIFILDASYSLISSDTLLYEYNINVINDVSFTLISLVLLVVPFKNSQLNIVTYSLTCGFI